MRLRHVLATAAVTAVISPVALCAAPAAFAAGDDTSPTPAATASASTTAPEQSASASAPNEASTPAASSAPASAPAQTSAWPSTSAPADDEPTCAGQQGDDRGKTSLRGLPSRIVAGSGWHGFTYRVTNESDVTLKQTVVSLYLGTADPDLDDIAQLDLTVQWRVPDTGEWVTIEGGDADPLASDDFAATTELAPGEYADAEMRLQVGTKAHPGDGYFFTIGYSYGEDGQCGFDDITQYDFTVLPATSDEGTSGHSTGKPGSADAVPAEATGNGKGGNAHAPQGGRAEIPVSGNLAATGSSSTLPTVAGIAAAAVVAGAATLVVVRRRRTTTAS